MQFECVGGFSNDLLSQTTYWTLYPLPWLFTISMFLPHMLSCTTRFCTCLITFCALLWLFSSVNADVPLQGSCSIDRAPAFFTVMWLLSTVGEKMLGKIFFCDWWKFATIALIWLLCGVCFDVISKITCLCSCIIAVSTCVAFPNCGLASAFSDLQLGQRNLHILRICVLSPQCGWSCASSNVPLDGMTSHILSKSGPSLHCEWACVFSNM